MYYEGEGFVAFPQNAESAIKLLALAKENGFAPEVIRTGDDGFYVPEELVELLFPTEQPVSDEPPAPAQASDEEGAS